MSAKQQITVYSNDVMAEKKQIERVVKDGITTYKNQKYMVHNHHGQLSINGTDPIRNSIDRFTDDEIIERAKKILTLRCMRGSFMESPEAIKSLCLTHLSREPAEVFGILLMDNRHRLLEYRPLFYGDIDSASVYTRAIMFAVYETNAASCCLVHCHPSGVAEPSRADLDITKRIKTALSYITCRVLDHIIVAGGVTVSLAERGEM